MRRIFLKLTGMALTVVSIFISTGCMVGDDEKKPEIVEDPLSTTTEYYISGKVTDNYGDALSNVSVKTNGAEATTDNGGQYKLVLPKTGTYAVSFTNSGYLTVNVEGTIAGSAAKRSMLPISVKMAKESAKEEVKTSVTSEVTITDKGKGNLVDLEDATAAITIVPGAISTDAKVSVTPYIEPINTSTQVNVGTINQTVPISNIVIASDKVITIEKPIKLAIKNKAINQLFSFDEVEVFNKSTSTKAAGDWVSLGKAVFNSIENSYEYNLAKGKKLGGEYSFRIENIKVTGKETGGEYNKELFSKSNAGNIEAIKNYEFSFNAWAGWSYITSATAALRKQGITDRGMAEMINEIVESQEGVSETYKVPYTLTTNISGNYVMSYSNQAMYCEKKYTFYVNSKGITVVLKVYTGMKESYINVDATQHSGGTGGNK